MPTVKLSLEEGFDKDHVVVTAGGTRLIDETGVSTRYQISLALQRDLELAGDEDELVIALPERGLQARVPLRPSPPDNVRASVSRDGRGIDISTEAPIGYA